MYNNNLDADLIKDIRILAAQLGKRQNDLFEEAIDDLLKKYKGQDTHEPRWTYLFYAVEDRAPRVYPWVNEQIQILSRGTT
jgi:hypothetical protein